MSTWLSCLMACLWYAAPTPILGASRVAGAGAALSDAHGTSRNAQLDSLYQSRQWFKLRRALQTTASHALHRGAVASAFNDTKEAERVLRSVVSSGQPEAAAEARGLLIYVCQRAGRYREALSLVEAALAEEPANAGLQSARALFGALSQCPDQLVAERRHSTAHYSLKGGNLLIPVEVDGQPAHYIVDTGASFSLISEGEAKRLGLTIHDGSGSKVSDAAGGSVGVRIAVAERLAVGHVRLRHVAFLVLPDDRQPFIDLAPGERGVLGLQVLLGIQSLRWNREGTIEVGFAPGSRSPQTADLCFEGGQVVVEAEYRQSRINLLLDTGATRTRALPLFAREFASVLGESARKDSARITGVGSSVEIDAATVPELTLRIGGFTATLRPAQVLLREPTSDSRRWHVWCGMDVLNQARMASIDFKSMTLGLQ